MSEKTVIYFSGGSMLGVFGAGVVTHLEEADVYKDISAVYGTSAGAFIGAYFLSRQTKLGSSIFYEDLTHDFISIPSFCIGVTQRLWGHVVGKMPWKNLRDAFDVDYLMNVAKKTKPLDVGKIETNPIPLYVKLFNITDRKIEYVDARQVGVFHALRATVQLLPYTHTPEHIGEKNYMDAGNIETIGLATLRTRHPHEKIVLVLSGETRRKRWRRAWKRYIEGKIMSYMFGRDLFDFYKKADKDVESDILFAQSDPKILVVAPPRNNSALSRTTNPKVLKVTYAMGIGAGKSIVGFIEG
ncbi:MAG: patatin-like phospholipase family protein [Patescibacteria group bacterium]